VLSGNHENIVGYFTSWFETENLYIQMELCDRCLSMNGDKPLEFGDALELLYQVGLLICFVSSWLMGQYAQQNEFTANITFFQ
jgi:wee1-like protein kinase